MRLPAPWGLQVGEPRHGRRCYHTTPCYSLWFRYRTERCLPSQGR
jgi:hypothetical protein